MKVFRRGHLGTESDRATFRTLHTASLASPALREGLTATSAERSLRHLRALLGTPAAALTDTSALLAWDGIGSHHSGQAPEVARVAVEHGSTRITDPRDLPCDEPACPVQHAIASPLVAEERIVGT